KAPARSAPFEVREVPGEAPRDLKFEVAVGEGGWHLHARKADEIVVIRRGDKRAGGATHAEILLDRADDSPIVVETTAFASFATVRTIVRMEKTSGSERPAFTVHLAEAPAAAKGSEAKYRHECKSQHDGFGGLTTICRVRASAGAANVTDDDPL